MNFVPFAMVLAILYFLILLPMKKQRKKVQEFQTGLKVGDKVVTTGGIYGLITRVNDTLRPAPDCRQGPHRDRAGLGGWVSGAGAGRPGIRKRLTHGCIQESSLEDPHDSSSSSCSSRPSGSIRSSRSATACRRPAWLMAKQLQARSRPQGRRAPRAAGQSRRCAADLDRRRRASSCARRCTAAGVTVGAINVTLADDLPRRGRAAGQGRRVPAHRRRADRRPTTTATSGVGGAYEFTMRPNIARGLREQTMVQAHDTIDRRVNELGVAEPNIAQHGDDGDQLLVQLPGVSDVARAKDIIQIDGAPRAQAGRRRAGADARGAAPGARRRRCRPTWKS